MVIEPNSICFDCRAIFGQNSDPSHQQHHTQDLNHFILNAQNALHELDNHPLTKFYAAIDQAIKDLSVVQDLLKQTQQYQTLRSLRHKFEQQSYPDLIPFIRYCKEPDGQGLLCLELAESEKSLHKSACENLKVNFDRIYDLRKLIKPLFRKESLSDSSDGEDIFACQLKRKRKINLEDQEKRKKILIEATKTNNFTEVAAKYNIPVGTLRNWKCKYRDDKELLAVENDLVK